MREYIILYAMPLEKAAERKIELASVHDSGKALREAQASLKVLRSL